jgi:signal transduction histidine kinase
MGTNNTVETSGDGARWWIGWQSDLALAITVGAIELFGTHATAHGQAGSQPLDALAYALLVAGPAALVCRRRFPIATYLVAFGTTLAYSTLGYPRGPIWLPLIITLFTIVFAGHREFAAATLVAGWAGFLWLPFLAGNDAAPTLAAALGLAAWLLVLLLSAEFVRARREAAHETARIQDEERRRRASEERLRIARELHDALGHQLSLINVQAGVALHVNEEIPEQAREALDAIKQASKEGLSELRSVLDILREGGEQAPRAPAPSVAQLDELVSRASVAGLTVRTEVHGSARPLPFGVDVAAYRIVQESLTNVARHAGMASATVALDYGDRELTVQVDDDGPGGGQGGRGNAQPGSGRGIVGMRERVTALGGALEAGPRSGGGFRVRARLPLEGRGP